MSWATRRSEEDIVNFGAGITVKKVSRIVLFVMVLTIMVVNGWLLLSGKTWVYKALVYNYVDIDDHRIFEQRLVPATSPRPWPLSAAYNRITLDTATKGELSREKSVAYLVIHRDSILYEQYGDGYSDSSWSNSFSMSKSFIGALTGIALREGLIESLDQQVKEFIIGYTGDPKGELTLRQLITMSAALSWDEAYSSLFSVTTEAYYGKDLNGLMDGLTVTGIPGREFVYQGGATQLLAMVIMKASGKTLSDYCSEKLWAPLGAEHAAGWSVDRKDGIEKASCCIYSNARDFARIGSLYLHQGNAFGKQVIDTAFIRESITPAPIMREGKPNTEYGFQWWLTSINGMEAFYCRGILGQYIAVIPSLDLVVVRLGHHRHQAPDGTLLDLPVYLNGAVEMAKKHIRG